MKKRKKTRSRSRKWESSHQDVYNGLRIEGILKKYKCQIKILIDNWKYLYNKINEALLGYKQTIKANSPQVID